MQDYYIAIELFNLPELDQLHILLWAGDTLLFQFCSLCNVSSTEKSLISCKADGLTFFHKLEVLF